MHGAVWASHAMLMSEHMTYLWGFLCGRLFDERRSHLVSNLGERVERSEPQHQAPKI
jgi:hypothetical protein